ncbi:ribonuclease HIII [Firmicutes bacterium CAG:822]|nr:ribonuclease HIII [Firmicutes bacterium CAG:822]
MKKEPVKTITLKVSDNTMEKMNEYFEDKKRLKTPPYAVFQADEADTVVTLYQSGKAVFQGISADIDANLWSQMEKNLNPNKNVDMKVASNEKKKETKKNSKVYYANTIGSDEVGTGDYFGPIVVTASYVTKEDIPFLESLGIKDSKKMTDEQILKITPQIIKKIPYYTMTLSNKEYNQRHSEYNMNAMKAILHNKALLEMTKQYKDYDYIVVDQFAEKYVYYNYLRKVPNVQRNITFITKAEDQCLSVACSAIISRYIFIKEFDKLSKKYNQTLPKGAGPIVDEIGAKLVKEYGIDVLNEIAKTNFKNTEKIKELIQK